MHIVTASPEAIEKLGPTVVVLAEAEGLDAHAASLRIRQDLLIGQNDD
jgi:histidinol dehydrogenase